jgi:hypothetical protein
MPANPTARDPRVQRLVEDGYAVVIEGNHLIVEGVPYVASAGIVAYGDLISAYEEVEGIGRFGSDHTVRFTGSVPCAADGKPLNAEMVADTDKVTLAGRLTYCRLSNKPDPIGDMLENIYTKMTHYIRKLTSHAQAVDPTVTAQGKSKFVQRATPSPFKFPNMTIAQAGLEAYEAKLAQVRKVAIIGVGGTGSYILDALAKCPVQTIHFYDDDVIEGKNVYRMPGVMGESEIPKGIRKADHLLATYSQMRTGLFAHPVLVTAANLHELNDCDFVFIAIDDGPSRGLIASHLHQHGIPFIDAGIGVERAPDDVLELVARSRVTLAANTPGMPLPPLPTAPDAEGGVYNNIQLIEINALNAMLAVIRFKQFIGFYADEVHAQCLRYVLQWNRLLTDRAAP